MHFQSGLYTLLSQEEPTSIIMKGSFLSCLALISLGHSVLAAPTGEPVKFRPVGINDYEAAVGLERRDDKQFADLDLQTQSQLVYGSAGSKSKITGKVNALQF